MNLLGSNYSSSDAGQKPGLGSVSSGELLPQLPSINANWPDEIKKYHSEMELFYRRLIDYIRRLQGNVISALQSGGGEINVVTDVQYDATAHRFQKKVTTATVGRIITESDWRIWSGDQPVLLPTVADNVSGPGFTDVYVLEGIGGTETGDPADDYDQTIELSYQIAFDEGEHTAVLEYAGGGSWIATSAPFNSGITALTISLDRAVQSGDDVWQFTFSYTKSVDNGGGSFVTKIWTEPGHTGVAPYSLSDAVWTGQSGEVGIDGILINYPMSHY